MFTIPFENSFPANSPFYPIAARLFVRPIAPLTPTTAWSEKIAAELSALHARHQNLPNTIAAFHLLNDAIDSAHALVQPLESDQTSCYLHQIVHRREGDWGNALYWVNRTGEHPAYPEIFESLKRETEGQLSERLNSWTRWEGGEVVQWSRNASRAAGDAADAVAILCWREMCELTKWIARHEH